MANMLALKMSLRSFEAVAYGEDKTALATATVVIGEGGSLNVTGEHVGAAAALLQSIASGSFFDGLARQYGELPESQDDTRALRQQVSDLTADVAYWRAEAEVRAAENSGLLSDLVRADTVLQTAIKERDTLGIENEHLKMDLSIARAEAHALRPVLSGTIPPTEAVGTEIAPQGTEGDGWPPSQVLGEHDRAVVLAEEILAQERAKRVVKAVEDTTVLSRAVRRKDVTQEAATAQQATPPSVSFAAEVAQLVGGMAPTGPLSDTPLEDNPLPDWAGGPAVETPTKDPTGAPTELLTTELLAAEPSPPKAASEGWFSAAQAEILLIDVLTVVRIANPTWSDDTLIAWCVEHQQEVPVLSRYKADRLPSRIRDNLAVLPMPS